MWVRVGGPNGGRISCRSVTYHHSAGSYLSHPEPVRGYIGDRIAKAIVLSFRKAFRKEQRFGGDGELLYRLPMVVVPEFWIFARPDR